VSLASLAGCGGIVRDSRAGDAGTSRGGTAASVVTGDFAALAERDDCPVGASIDVDWQLENPALGREIEGYASATSVNHGEPIDVYVSTRSVAFTADVYRMGWYGGAGAEKVLGPLSFPGRLQPDPALDENGEADCGWIDPFTIPTTGDWKSGAYLVKLTTVPDGKQRYVTFVVRDDGSTAPLLFQTSVTTYQAYNEWGGRSLYTLPKAAYKVSFNRPYDDGRYGDGGGAGHFLYWEYPMLRWLERQGYDVTYSTDVDTHERGSLLLNHRAFLSVGHDEYWTRQQRQNVEAARDAGVNLGFFSANTCYWQIRLEPDARGNPDRRIVCYKLDAPSTDPAAKSAATFDDVTTEFRLPHLGLGGNGEEWLIGVQYFYGKLQGDTAGWRVQDPTNWIFAGTDAKEGDVLPKTLGYEVDTVLTVPGDLEQTATTELADLHLLHQNGVIVAHSPYPYSQDGRTEYADSTVYQAASGAIVFATGTVQWAWGLSSCGTAYPTRSGPTLSAQRITRNVLDAMISGTTDLRR
jgi:hypothetical protein